VTALGLEFLLFIDFEKRQGVGFSNLIYVTFQTGPTRDARHWWISTHDFDSLQNMQSGTLKCAVTIPRFKPKQTRLDLKVVVDVMSGLLFVPGQTFSSPVGMPIPVTGLAIDPRWVSNEAAGQLTLD